MLAIFGSGEEIFQKVATLVKGKAGKKVTRDNTQALPKREDAYDMKKKGIQYFE